MKRVFKILFLSIGVLLVFFAGYYFLVKKLDKDVMEMKGAYASLYSGRRPILLPSSFIGGRFYIKMPTASGDTILAFGDSGGGISMALPSVTGRPEFQPKIKTALLKGVMPMKYISFYDVVNDRDIPPPFPLRSLVLRHPLSRVEEPFLFIPPMDDELRFLMQVMHLDIFLGQNFFMGKSWTFDYPNHQIWVNTPLPESEEGRPDVQRLGFKKNNNHENIFGHPSMYIEVDGEVIEVLFDTGASIILSENGKKAFGTTEKSIAGSFIAKSVFEKWRKAHPDWKHYEKADMRHDIIEVPSINIGGYEVGPVLFAERDDENWSQGMISTMDTVVKGAIGGSALKYLKVTIDYNSSLIKFEK